MYRSVQSSTDSVHSVKPCISGNLSVGSVTLYKSVQHCIGKGWFADVVKDSLSLFARWKLVAQN